MPDIVVTHVPERERYEIRVDGERVGFATARRRNGVVTMPHVEIDPAHRGKDYANQLVRAALEDVAAKGERVQPLCPFVLAFLRRNPKYQPLVS